MERKVSYRDPPGGNTLVELLTFVRDFGIGLSFDANGLCGTWSDDDLESQFSVVGRPIDKRSIQNWFSGAKVPKVQNLRVLAKIITRTRQQEALWIDAFIAARRSDASQKASASQTKIQQAVDASSDAEEAAVHGRSGHAETESPSRRLSTGHRIALMAGFLVILFVALTFQIAENADAVTDIIFCDETHFSENSLDCSESMTSFAEGTTTIFVTFDSRQPKNGEPFQRIWYRAGKQFLRRDSYFDDAWPGYTYLHFDDALEIGQYTLRVIVKGKVKTATFQVGEGHGRLDHHSSINTHYNRLQPC